MLTSLIGSAVTVSLDGPNGVLIRGTLAEVDADLGLIRLTGGGSTTTIIAIARIGALRA